MNFVAIKALEDNYMYLLYNDEEAVSVDPLLPSLILEALSRKFTKQFYESVEDLQIEEKCPKRKLLYNFTTHSHLDHAGGNRGLAELSPNTVFISGFDEEWCRDENPGKKTCKDGDVIKEKDFEIHCIHTPCHTKNSFCYLMDSGNKSYLLTGDTIFFLGCGMFFEGNGEDMAECMKKIVRRVSDDTLVLYGHNYNVNDLKFSKTCAGIEIPEEIEKRRFLTLGEEKAFNPFLRAAMGKNASRRVQRLRETKNRFDGGLSWNIPSED